METIEDYRAMAQEALDREKASQKRLDELIAALKENPRGGVPAADDDDEDAIAAKRAEKFSKLELSMRKSTKVKDFKEAQENISVKEWLNKFDEEMLTCKRMNGIHDNLTREEVVALFKDKLDYAVVRCFDSAFAAKDVPYTWAAVTYDQLKEVMKEEYASKICDVSEV